VWVDIERPDDADRRLLAETFRFHELSVEDAMEEVQHPKIEAYDGYLYGVLHGIGDAAGAAGIVTSDVDFFLGPTYLVTVRHGPSQPVADLQAICVRHDQVLAEGPAALFHRIVDRMVDDYRPAVDALEDRLEAIEHEVFESPQQNPVRAILAFKRDIAGLRRVALPQRDAVGRLARREFPEITDALAYRFRDVYDHLVQVTDDAASFQDRVTGLLDAYLSTQSNRLNHVMKLLTVIATIFMPLTVLTGLYGMNVPVPHFPGGDAVQFWWLLAIMLGLSGGMLWMFRRMEWL